MDPQKKSKSKGLSTGCLIGLGLGCVAVPVAIFFLIIGLSTGGQGYPLGGKPTLGDLSSISSQVPTVYREIFLEAGEKFDTPPALLAAIFACGEHGGSFPKNPNGPWATSYKGAKGPFQFTDPTWQDYGYDGDGDRIKDVQNLKDASYGAANLLSANIQSHRGTMEQKIKKAIFRYNHSPKYVQQVYDCFIKFLSAPYFYLTDADLAPPLGSFTSQASINSSPHTVDARGHGLFSSRYGGKNEHGDGIDFFTANDEEKPVYAVSDGIVERKDELDSAGYGYGGWYVYIYNQEAGVESCYVHILPRSDLKVGQEVRKGEQIGIIYSKKRKPKLGFKSNAHLHFQLWMKNKDGQMEGISQKQLKKMFRGS